MCCCLSVQRRLDRPRGREAVDAERNGDQAGSLDGNLEGDELSQCVFDAYGLCPTGDEACAATRPSASLGTAACECGKYADVATRR